MSALPLIGIGRNWHGYDHRLNLGILILACCLTVTFSRHNPTANARTDGATVPCIPGIVTQDSETVSQYLVCGPTGYDVTVVKCRDGYQFCPSASRCQETCSEIAENKISFWDYFQRDYWHRRLKRSADDTADNGDNTARENIDPAAPDKFTDSPPDGQNDENGNIESTANATDTDPKAPLVPEATTKATSTVSSTSVKPEVSTTTVPTAAAVTTQPTTTTATMTTAPPLVATTSASPAPPIVTESPLPPDDVTVSHNDTLNGGTDPDEGSGTNVGAIVAGVVIGLVILVAAVIIIVFVLRKKKFSKNKSVTKMENPQYKKESAPEAKYRFSELNVHPTVDFSKMTGPGNGGPAALPTFRTEGERGSPPPKPKRSVPVTKPVAARRSDKRRAPPPPNPFDGGIEEEKEGGPQIYEQDSGGSTEDVEMLTFTARNDKAKLTPDKGQGLNESERPLLKRHSKSPAPIPRASHQPEDPLDSNVKVEEEDLGADDPSDAHARTELLPGKDKHKSNESLDRTMDEYDKSLNPFFTKS